MKKINSVNTLATYPTKMTKGCLLPTTLKSHSEMSHSAQQGFTLLELMIAMSLGVLVLFAILKIFIVNLEGVNLQNTYARVQENGRMSMELLSRDIRMADYWGCINDIDTITNNLDTSDDDYDASLVPVGQQALSGENDVSSSSIAGISVNDGTDTFTLRGATSFSDSKLETPYMTATDADITISTGSAIDAGTMLLISDCEQADLFTNSSANTDTSGIISHGIDTLGEGYVDNASADFGGIYNNSAQLLTVYVKSYFIGENSAGSYSLYRSYNGIASEMVRDVSDLQLTYGEDTSGDGSADTFSNASLVSEMDDVVAIRLQLVSASGEGSSGTALARTYRVTTNIRNRTLQ